MEEASSSQVLSAQISLVVKQASFDIEGVEAQPVAEEDNKVVAVDIIMAILVGQVLYVLEHYQINLIEVLQSLLFQTDSRNSQFALSPFTFPSLSPTISSFSFIQLLLTTLTDIAICLYLASTQMDVELMVVEQVKIQKEHYQAKHQS